MVYAESVSALCEVDAIVNIPRLYNRMHSGILEEQDAIKRPEFRNSGPSERSTVLRYNRRSYGQQRGYNWGALNWGVDRLILSLLRYFMSITEAISSPKFWIR